jgi:hypothetical protein
MSDRDWDETDCSSEVEDARQEAFIRKCAKRDMDQGIDPTWFTDEDNE